MVSVLDRNLSMPLEPKLAPCGWRCPHRRPALTGPFGNWYLMGKGEEGGGGGFAGKWGHSSRCLFTRGLTMVLFKHMVW